MTRILLLGGTTEARRMAEALAAAGVPGIYSYAGRTEAPVPQALPVRVGGFGGAEGLAQFLRAEGISHVIDATHPFAARISANAVAACESAQIPLIALERPPWPGPGVPDIAAAVAALPRTPATVFLAIGRQNLGAFAGLPHRWLLRLVDPAPQPLPNATVVIARGPFTEAGDRALMQAQGVQIVVAKNAGGDGARAKLDAAGALGLPVILIDRPAVPPRRIARTVAEVLDWLHDVPRGV